MKITFLVPTHAHPMGGAVVLYEFANGMTRRGHSVCVVHLVIKGNVSSVGDIPWFTFEEGIEHRFPQNLESYELPEADFISSYDAQHSRRHGLPFNFVQGYKMWPAWFEELTYRAPCPKVCVAKWLLETAKRIGVPAHQLFYIPPGLKHDKYRLVSPIENRPPQVSMLYRTHVQKGAAAGLAALRELKKRIPELEAVLFSQQPPAHKLPAWMTFLTDPPQEVIVGKVYNRSRVFLCSSRNEAFGLSSIEAMACGAALVTTSNGGSDDYAIDGETALVSGVDDLPTMVDHMEALMRHDEQRIRLAQKGREFVRKTFDWEVSNDKLQSFLNSYGADPDRYMQ